MWRVVAYVLAGLVAVAVVGATVFVSKFNKRYFRERPNWLRYAHVADRIPFQWAGQRYGDKVEPYAALVIPATIAGIPRKFSLQFDTGTPHSTLYGKPLASLMDRGLPIALAGEKGNRLAKNVELTLGRMQ